ncbi:MAG: RNHCP domain-containing protein [Lachnospiraceae bacterium]|nr:RNHCP domain-containing protein [Lachnospiraceae bacterium]
METKKFSKNDDEFICENCGSKVEKLGYTSRNHCPKCLYSKHVDINPGDRAETCHGMLEPVGIEINPKKGYIIVSKCKKCESVRKNKAADDDDIEKIIELSGNNK